MTDNYLTNLTRAIAAVAPHADATAWAAALEAPMQSAGLTTPNRIAMFIGQVADESMCFEALTEDLYYTTAARIAEVWPSHFATASAAAAYVCSPVGLANLVYANRMGNGDEASGDGWTYRGRGLIQITGKQLYQSYARVEPRAADPDWLATVTGAAGSACWWWSLPNPGRPSLNALSDAWAVSAVTQRINGSQAAEHSRFLLASAAKTSITKQV